MSTRLFSCIEPLEARIAPAVIINNPLPNIVAGSGKTGATIDLSKVTAAASNTTHRTFVQFVTNFDTDPVTAGIQKGIIEIELYDDLAPLTVQNFLSYVNSLDPTRDYNGTIFHRSYDFGTGSGAGNDIIQGGGFQIPGFAHIPVGPAVHNEFDGSRPDAAYTIAMAKVGGDPNSATSEWFFNKNDNTDILGAANNGGFTVFGRVTSAASKAVIDGIAALPKQNFGGVLTDMPVQNYNADPDNNPGTPKPVPTADQVIRIIDAKMLPNVPASTTGLTFTVQSIFAATTTTPSDLLTAKVTGSKLALKYTPGKSGLADVTVKVSDGTTSTTDTFRVDVRPNLIARIDKDVLPGVLVPGDSGALKFRLTNNGAAAAGGLVDIMVSLVSNGAQPAIPLTTLANVNLNLAGGASKLFAPVVKIPTTLATNSGETYHVVVEVDPKSGSAAAERFTDDDVALNGSTHQLVNRFGTFSTSFGFRANAVLQQSATDVLGHSTIVTWSLAGGGYGSLTPDGKTLETFGTNATSTITAKLPVGSAHFKLEGISFNDVIGKAALGSIDVAGAVIASGGLKSLTLGDLNGQALMLIGSVAADPSAKVTLNLGNVKEFSLESDQPISTLNVLSWLDRSSAADAITAPSIGSLRSAGDFEADVTLSDDVLTSVIAIKGFMRGSTFKTLGNIGTVTVGAMSSSNLFAGVNARPATLADFDEARTISRFTVTGIGDTELLFGSSTIAAQTIGTIKVRGVNPAPAAAFGFIADVIRSYSRLNGPTKTNLTTAQTLDTVGNYSVRIL